MKIYLIEDDKKLRQELAKKENNVSVAEIKRQMRLAVEQAWNNPDKTPDNMLCSEAFLRMAPFRRLRL